MTPGLVSHPKAVRLAISRSGTRVVVHWREFTGATAIDPVTGAKNGVSVARSFVTKGLTHFAGATTTVRSNVEIEVGDCILDVAGDVELDDKDGLRLEINGEFWEPKPIGDRLGRSWDVVAGGVRILRTVLLKKVV